MYLTQDTTKVTPLPTTFIGKGEVRGFEFQQLQATDHGYLYQVTIPGASMHYEVFERRINTRFNTETYPNSKAFGIWAYQTRDLARAEKRLQDITDRAIARNSAIREVKTPQIP